MAKIQRRDAEKALAPVAEQYVFWSHDGRVIRDLKELAEALNTMSDETFAYHSNAEKHDFSNWVRDIMGDAKLAGDLEQATSRLPAARMVADRVVLLSKKLA